MSNQQTAKSSKKIDIDKTTTKDQLYSGIKSNVARLHAMISGIHVQYIRYGEEYKTWLVNDGQDSVLLCSFPAGNPAKNGYWIYHYQILTSLPDKPFVEVFEKLVAIDRDSIYSSYYDVPPNFNVPFDRLKKEYKTLFNEINFSRLKPSKEHCESLLYVRESPLVFNSSSTIIPNFQNENEFRKYEHQVRPSEIMCKFHSYKKDKKQLISTSYEKFVKLTPLF